MNSYPALLTQQPDDTSNSEGCSPGVVEVTVNEASDIDEALNSAVGLVLEAATRHKTGILVTRMESGRYVVRAHPGVPFGLIRQCHS